MFITKLTFSFLAIFYYFYLWMLSHRFCAIQMILSKNSLTAKVVVYPFWQVVIPKPKKFPQTRVSISEKSVRAPEWGLIFFFFWRSLWVCELRQFHCLLPVFYLRVFCGSWKENKGHKATCLYIYNVLILPHPENTQTLNLILCENTYLSNLFCYLQ